ncbi:MAG TPA: aspartate/glutamate racemase family protein [Bryobacteraceae bacterium]|jgi:aspartate racemase
MKTIGLIGGMSWESSAHYYRLINEETHQHLGGHHNAPSVMVTVDFAEIEQRQHAGDWDRLGGLLAAAASQVEAGGADFLVLCTNTMHKLAGAITDAVAIPLLHIVDVTAQAILLAGHRRVGLLGTRFTMEEPFYADRMRDRFGLEVLIPSERSRETVHEVIYGELCHGVVRPESAARYRGIIAELGTRGAEGVILGCTEIGMLINEESSALPVYDSTILHARAAVAYALE